jgi:hypothetical protein
MPCLGTTETIQRVGLLDGTSITRANHSSDRQSVQYHCRLFAPVLSAAAALGLYWISNFDSLHASPMVGGTWTEFKGDRKKDVEAMSALMRAKGVHRTVTPDQAIRQNVENPLLD